MFGRDKKVGLSLLLSGSCLVGVSGYLLYQDNQQVLPPPVIAVQEPEFTTQLDGVPAYLRIASAAIDIPVVPGQVVGGRWSIAPQGNYLHSSARMGDAGNIVVYGHNNDEALGALHEATVGDTIYARDAAGHEREYIISHVYVTNADDREPLEATDTEVLTIYTCAGFLDTKRLIVTATPA